MPAPQNQAAWLHKPRTALQVHDAPFPKAGEGEIVVKNAAVAINPLDCHMQSVGVFVQQWPTVFGCDIAGEVYEIGPNVDRFKKGDRVIAHPINLTTGRPSDGAFALYTNVPADKAAILPDHISFTDGVVVPSATEAAVCTLSIKEPSPTMPMPWVLTSALALPYPSLEDPAPSIGKTLLVWGASSSVGSMTTQIAAATGIHVIATAGASNHEMVMGCGAAQVFDYKDSSVVEKVVEAVKGSKTDFIGIFDAISFPETYEPSLAILEKLGGGHLVCVHPPPSANQVPSNVKTGMIFAVDDVTTPVFKDFVTPALQSGRLKCLPPPTVVGKGLEHIDEALKMSKAGVSGTKLVVEL